jgi:hypothetical protein
VKVTFTMPRTSVLTMTPNMRSMGGLTREAMKYNVEGLLPEEGRAWFFRDGVNWTILREKDGVYTDGVEQYESPEAALASMNAGN